MKKILLIINCLLIFHIGFSQGNKIPKFVQAKAVSKLPSDIKSTEYTISVFVFRNMTQGDEATANELKSMLKVDLQKMGMKIIEGDMISVQDKKTILVSMSIMGQGKAENEQYLLEIRNYVGASPKSKTDTYYKITASSYDKLVKQLYKVL